MTGKAKARAAEPRPAQAAASKKAKPPDRPVEVETAPAWLRQAAFGTGAALAGLGGAAAGVADAPGPFGVLVDRGAPGQGQMAREAFMQRLDERVRAAADDELAQVGKTAKDCPYLATWLAFYRDKPAAHIERAIRLYTHVGGGSPSSLSEAVEGRVRAAVRRWRETGDLTGIPAETPLMADASSAGTSSASLRSLPSDAPAPGSPADVLTRLGPGRPLEPGVRARMERGLDADLRDVRVHSDATGARMAQRLGARAFAVGEHVAFHDGEYRPGTLVGDAVLAHELAHTRQQRGASREATTSGPALERDADRATAGALGRLWAGVTSVGASLTTSMRSGGLALSRCTPLPLTESQVTVPQITSADEDFLTELEGTESIEADYEEYYWWDRIANNESRAAAATPAASAGVDGDARLKSLDAEGRFAAQAQEVGYSARTGDWAKKKDQFEGVFEKTAVAEAYNELARHETLVQGELDRYAVKARVDELRAALLPYQSTLEKVRDERAAGAKVKRTVKGGVYVMVDPPGAETHRAAAKSLAEPVRAALVAKYPIVVADDLDIERVLLASDSEAQGHLEDVAQRRVDNIQKTRGAIKDKPSRVWKFDRAVALARARLGIVEGSVFDQMIQDRNARESYDDLFKNLLLGALALGLGLLSGGTGTVALLAASAGAGMSVGLASAHLRDFLIAEAAAGTALERAQALSSEEPSLFWLAVDVIAAFGDIAIAAKAFQSLKPVAAGVKTLADVEKLRAPAKALAEAEKVTDAGAAAEKVVQQAKQHVTAEEAIKAAETTDKALVVTLRAAVTDEQAIAGLLKLDKAVLERVLGMFKGAALNKLGALLAEYPQVAKTVEGLFAKLPAAQFKAVMGKYLLSRGTQSKYLLRAAADAELTAADFETIASALKTTKSSKQVAIKIGGLIIDRIAERLPAGQKGIETFRKIAPGLHPNQSAQIFERWAARNIYNQAAGAERFTESTATLTKEYEAMKPSFKGERISTDNVLRDAGRPGEAGIGDFKSHLTKRNLASDADAVKQADNYAEMLRVGVKTPKGEKFTWVEYLFANRDSASASSSFLVDKFGDAVKIYFVDEKGLKQIMVIP